MSLTQACLPEILKWRNPWESESYSQRQFRKATAEAGFVITTIIATTEMIGCGILGEFVHFYYPNTSCERWLFRQSRLGMESFVKSFIASIANPFVENITLEKTELCYRIILDNSPLEFSLKGIKGVEFTTLLKTLLQPLENKDQIYDMIHNNDDDIYEPAMFMLFFYYYKTRKIFEGLSQNAIDEIDKLPEIEINLKPHEVFMLKLESKLDALKEYREIFNHLGKLTTAEIYGPMAKEFLPMAGKKMQ